MKVKNWVESLGGIFDSELSFKNRSGDAYKVRGVLSVDDSEKCCFVDSSGLPRRSFIWFTEALLYQKTCKMLRVRIHLVSSSCTGYQLLVFFRIDLNIHVVIFF